MATRSVIRIEGVNYAQVYFHWDGYPEHMLPWLQTFNKEFAKNLGGGNGDYKMAQLLRFSERHKRKFNLDKSKYTGYGIVAKDGDYGADFIYRLHEDGSVSYHQTY